jgi:uncharacterized protein YneF (UPF0154 family)
MTDASVTDEGRAGEVMEGKAGQDIKVALVVIAFVLGGFFVARDYPLTAAAWPYGILAIMLCLAAILIGLGAWRSRRQSAEPTSVPGEPGQDHHRARQSQGCGRGVFIRGGPVEGRSAIVRRNPG